MTSPKTEENTVAFQTLVPSKSGWLSWGGKGVLALTDQGLIGGSNFLIGILLARQLSPSQYGAYAVAFELFMVLSLAYACLILEPMLVFGPSTYLDNFREYFGTLVWLHLVVTFATAIALGGLAWLVSELGKSPSLSRALVGSMLAVPFVLLFWLARRAFYVKLDPKTAVLGGLLYCIVLLGGVFAFYELRLLSPFVAFLLMAAGALPASVMLLRRLKPSIRLRARNLHVRSVVRTHWTYGRWALAAAIACWVSGNIYYVFLSSLRGLADTGTLKAVLNLTGPVGQLFAAVSLLALPYAARVYKRDGTVGVEQLSWRLASLYAGAAAAYWVVLVSFERPVLHFLYAGKYLHIEYLLPLTAIGSVFRITTVVEVCSLKASQSPFLAFLVFIFSDVFACVLGIPAIWFFGVKGAIWAYTLSGGVGLLSGFVLVHRMACRGGEALTCSNSVGFVASGKPPDGSTAGQRAITVRSIGLPRQKREITCPSEE